jgi:hypothetical protein
MRAAANGRFGERLIEVTAMPSGSFDDAAKCEQGPSRGPPRRARAQEPGICREPIIAEALRKPGHKIAEGIFIALFPVLQQLGYLTAGIIGHVHRCPLWCAFDFIRVFRGRQLPFFLRPTSR